MAPQYLSFLVTLSHVPVLYIHGNHDECYLSTPPEGCVCIDDDLIVYNGIRIMGLGGSMRYRPGTFQFTERQMRRRYTKLKRKLFLKGGVDILVCHSPAKGINDGEDLPHTGFSVFKEIMTKYKPKYFVHGHVHKHTVTNSNATTNSATQLSLMPDERCCNKIMKNKDVIIHFNV